MIVSSNKHHVLEQSKSQYESKMTMIVRKFQKEDVGSYRCIAKNSLGEVDSSIRLYGEFIDIVLCLLFYPSLTLFFRCFLLLSLLTFTFYTFHLLT